MVSMRVCLWFTYYSLRDKKDVKFNEMELVLQSFSTTGYILTKFMIEPILANYNSLIRLISIIRLLGFFFS